MKTVLKGRAAKVEEGGQDEYVQARSQARHVWFFILLLFYVVSCRVMFCHVSVNLLLLLNVRVRCVASYLSY